MNFDLIIFTFATGFDTSTAMNTVRIPLYKAFAQQLNGRGKVLIVTHYVTFVPDAFCYPTYFARRILEPRMQRQARNLFVYSPVMPVPLAPLERLPSLLQWMKLWLRWQVRSAMQHIGMQNQVRVVSVNDPFHHYLLGMVGESLAVYDCHDEYSLYGGVDVAMQGVLKNEHCLVHKVDLVFTTSHALYNKMRNQHDKVHYFPNAVDFEFFHTAINDSTPVAPSLLEIPRPIVGFMGNLTHWYDFGLLRSIISKRQDWNFVFIGWVTAFPSCSGDIKAIQALPNTYFLGCQPFESLPSFLKGFDVAIMPYQMSGAGPTVNPDKMYQYMAAGVPLVATPTPEIAQYAGVIDVADDVGDFISAIERCLAKGRKNRQVDHGIAIARRQTWNARVDEELSVISKLLGTNFN